MSEDRPKIDWEKAYARLELTRRALEAADAPGEADAQRVLKERAHALSRPPVAVPRPSETLDLVVFSVGPERYAIETAHVVDVVRSRGLTPVPCTPAFVLGVLSHRGSVLPVLDLRKLLERPAPPASEAGRVVALEAGGIAFGIAADTVERGVRVATDELTAPPAALEGGAFVRGVTADMAAVLDVEALAGDQRILVDEEVG